MPADSDGGPGSVAHATTADLPGVAVTLGRAFADDPVQQWLFQDVADLAGALERFMAFFVERYFDLGHLYIHAGPPVGVAGAALWAPPDRHALSSDDLVPLVALVAAELGDETEATVRLGELGRSFDYLPAEPHFYLGIAGVDPDRQGTGIGARLLASCLDQCDAGGFVAHLESSNPRNVPFYERLGFRVVDRFALGGPDGPVMTPMRRPPQ